METQNILVSSGDLIPTLSKMILFKLNSFIPCENVYSTSKRLKLVCFQDIQKRFSIEDKFIVIGYSEEEKEAAKAVIFLSFFL